MNQREIRALVVEDNSSWQQILQELLTDLGLKVDIADSYDVALAAIRANPHRLAIVDLSLGSSGYRNQDGLQVLAAIRQHDPACATVLLSGYLTVEVAVDAMKEYGAYTSLRKETFRRKQLQELAHRLLATAPIPANTPAANVAPAPAAKNNGKPELLGRALVVEDNAGWQSVLAELLAESGIATQSSNSFGEALGYLRREKFLLAVVDLSLASSIAPESNRDGYRVLAYAREIGLPTVVVSGKADPSQVEETYRTYDIFAYQEKQAFERETFRRTVQSILRQRPPRETGLELLTPREREILSLLAQGLSNKEIARALTISTNTVKQHLKSVFSKLNVTSRSAAVAKAISAGIKVRPPR